MSTLFAAQFAVPLALILWMALAPPRSSFGFGLQFTASAACPWAKTLQGIWLLPPWWAPSGFGLGLAVAACVGLRQRRPFASFFSTNQHLMTLGTSVPGSRASRGQSCGVDIVQLDAFGLRARGVQPADPSAYRIHGTRVLAPCAGQVVLAVDGLPDMQVPEVDREHLAGNHVLLRCANRDSGGGADVLVGHLRPRSVQVLPGATVAVGDWLGSVGNSGNTGEPHLHVHAQGPGTAGAPFGGDPMPILFIGRYPVRGDRIESP